MQFALEIPDEKVIVEFNAICFVQEVAHPEAGVCLEVSLINGTSFFWRNMDFEKWRKLNADFNREMARQQQQNKNGLILP